MMIFWVGCLKSQTTNVPTVGFAVDATILLRRPSSTVVFEFSLGTKTMGDSHDWRVGSDVGMTTERF